MDIDFDNMLLLFIKYSWISIQFKVRLLTHHLCIKKRKPVSVAAAT